MNWGSSLRTGLLLSLVCLGAVSFTSTAQADPPWWQRPEDWGKKGIIVVPPRDPPHHNPIVEVPSSSEPRIQFDQGVQSRPIIRVINGQRYLQRNGRLLPLAPTPAVRPSQNPTNGQRLGQTAPRYEMRNGRWVLVR